MKKLVLGFLMVGITAMQLQGRLMESEKEIEARYGAPVDKDTPANPELYMYLAMHYRFHNFDIEVIFLNHKSACEKYTKRGNFQDDEVHALLDVNALGSKWAQRPEGGWVLESGAARAALESGMMKPLIATQTLVVTSQDLMKYNSHREQEAKEKADEERRKNMEGF